MTLAGITAGFLQYLALLWVLWRCVEPTKQLIHQRFPKVPVEEIDKSFFRPVLLVIVDPHLCPDAGQPGIVVADFPW